ncbi:MAG: hypothetical protein ACREU8_02650 [Gammaproteobacteria bacterium]
MGSKEVAVRELYLIGTRLFKRTAYGRLPLSHLVGLALLREAGLKAFQAAARRSKTYSSF